MILRTGELLLVSSLINPEVGFTIALATVQRLTRRPAEAPLSWHQNLGLCNNRVAPYVSINGVSLTQAAYADLIGADPVLPMPYYNDLTVASTSAGNIRRLSNEGLLRRIQH